MKSDVASTITQTSQTLGAKERFFGPLEARYGIAKLRSHGSVSAATPKRMQQDAPKKDGSTKSPAQTRRPDPNSPDPDISVMDAIYGRHAVRLYLPRLVERPDIEDLLKAAVNAPTAMHEEPWAFAVVQNAELLKLISDEALNTRQEDVRNLHFEPASGGISRHVMPEIDVLHGAGTLIVIYGRMLGPFVSADCWLAAQNIMLAARAHGLATCVVGMAVVALNDSKVKNALGVPAEMTAIAPIVVGYQAGISLPSERKAPMILAWK